MASLFSDYLTALGVKHTESYSDRRFAEMPFQSMFGLANLLKEYGVGTAGISVDKESRTEAMMQLPVPFLADTSDGFAIVTDVSSGIVTYATQHKQFQAPVGKMLSGWNGIALLAAADAQSVEPEYFRHHVGEIADKVKRWVLMALAVLLVGFAMWASGLYSHWAAWVIVALDCAGLWLSWMLVQKSLGIRSGAADAVCSMLEEGGCDEIARSEASSFMGIFKWAEVGLAYFSVSLLAMLLFPQTLPVLAAINLLCLPYTFWSILYQKFKAKVWCTLCVCVQATLWLLFGAYLAGRWTANILPFTSAFWIGFAVLACCYGAVLLGINALDNGLSRHLKNDSNESSSNT